MQNYYDILGLPLDATPEEIRDAYFSAARKYHPDVNPLVTSTEEFLRIQKAYEILSDPDKRAKYDGENGFIYNANDVLFEVKTSRTIIPQLDEPQLFYIFFELSCSNSVRKNESPSCHICLTLDHSTSMDGERMAMVKNSAIHLVEQMKPNDYLSIVSFSDRPELILPPGLIKDKNYVIGLIQSIQVGGSTEIFQGLRAGVDTLMTISDQTPSKVLVLLTDGHTYGDEEKSIELIRFAAEQGISFNAIGIGSEWNDRFLDNLSSISGGSTLFVTHPQQLVDFFDLRIQTIHNLYARNVQLVFEKDPTISISYAFRLSPNPGSLELSSPIMLGDMFFDQSLSVIFECLIHPLPANKLESRLIDGKIWMQHNSESITNRRIKVNIRCPIRPLITRETAPKEIVDAMAKLTLYRLQEKARQEVEGGELGQAKRHFHHLATHLLAQGKRELARTVLMEAEYLQENEHFSAEGEKRIKYGTRSLLGLPEPNER